MKVIRKKIIFWNWKREARNVLMRYDRKCIALCKKSESLIDLISSNEKESFVDIKEN